MVVAQRNGKIFLPLQKEIFEWEWSKTGKE